MSNRHRIVAATLIAVVASFSFASVAQAKAKPAPIKRGAGGGAVTCTNNCPP